MAIRGGLLGRKDCNKFGPLRPKKSGRPKRADLPKHDGEAVRPIIDIHVHIMPYHMVKASALELIKHGRKDYADVERYSNDPKAFLGFLDSLGVERAG